MPTMSIWTPEAFVPEDPPPLLSRDTTTGHMYAAFDAAADELVDLVTEAPQGMVTTGSHTLRIRWRAASATTGNVVWSAQVEALTADDTTDTDTTESFATAQTVTDAAPGTAGYQTVAEITISQANFDSVAAGDRVRIRLSRDANNASDTMAGDAEVLAVEWRDGGT